MVTCFVEVQPYLREVNAVVCASQPVWQCNVRNRLNKEPGIPVCMRTTWCELLAKRLALPRNWPLKLPSTVLLLGAVHCLDWQGHVVNVSARHGGHGSGNRGQVQRAILLCCNQVANAGLQARSCRGVPL